MLEQGDIDAALQYLIEQADPNEWARIHAMSDDQRRKLAELAYQQCDKLGEDGFDKGKAEF